MTEVPDALKDLENEEEINVHQRRSGISVDCPD
jgi:hypothetical protein